MYTKFFLFLVVSLLLASLTASVTISRQKQTNPIENGSDIKNIKSEKIHSANDLLWNINWPDHADKDHHPHQDDDAKEHKFHLNRFNRIRRGKKVCCVLATVGLVVIHICLLIFSFAQTITWFFM